MARLRDLLLCTILSGLGGTAGACINDDESPTHEREFRSQYGGLAGAPTVDEFAYRHPLSFNVLIGGGSGMLVGAFVLAAKRTRSKG